jgi:hypothetical protein
VLDVSRSVSDVAINLMKRLRQDRLDLARIDGTTKRRWPALCVKRDAHGGCGTSETSGVLPATTKLITEFHMARSRPWLLGTGLLAIIALPLPVQADPVTLFNTFGPSHTYECCAGRPEFGSNVGGNLVAMAFSPGSTSPLFGIDLAIGTAKSVSGVEPFSLALMSSNGGVPGSTIESWNLATNFRVTQCTDCFETALSTLRPVLQAGTQYWLVVFPNPDFDGDWMLSLLSNPAIGTIGSSLDNGSTWTAVPNSQLGAFDVTGVTSTPEPSTLILLAGGFLGIPVAARRKLRRATA